MKKFNLLKALSGEPVITRSGLEVLNLQMTNKKLLWPLTGYVKGVNSLESFTIKGYYYNETYRCEFDLFMKDKDDEKAL